MKKIFMRFNDLRRKEFSIKTSIYKDKSKKWVVKEAVFEEGIQHIKNILDNANLLKNNYSVENVCPVKLEGKQLIFDYIEGVSLADMYLKAYNDGNKEKFLELVDFHKKLVLLDEDNLCVFKGNAKFEEIFGDYSIYEGKEGLKISNFEGTAYNVILENGNLEKPVFIDYEWVFDFNMPKDFILYQCITSIYFMVPELESFIPKLEIINHLNLEVDESNLYKSFMNFYNYQMKGTMEKSLAEIKYSYLKKSINVNELINDGQIFIGNEELRKNLNWYINRVKELEGAIKYHQANDVYLKDRNDEIQKELDWYQKRTKDLEEAIEYHHNLDKQLEEALDNSEQQQQIIEKKNEELNSIILDLRKNIFEMENSRSWRWTRFFRKSKK